MAGKHTPGPWETFFNGGGHIGVKAGYYTITWVAGDRLPSVDEQEANARLIAAAPELLEACRMIVEAASEDDPMAAGMLAGCAVTAAEAAIARATQPLPPTNEE